ncbi:predicted protein [Lichtheimia corymbifera JMRC:FSU:9682]|uniref:RRM domain-containing protein n=1 Tax=Lichtheimia corymbifera JMRC:FSU:9682 TaxID=1263082 RepID=A0A068RK21_9FUNG|nr:predicted protein [Lichtheimia corymbifera JMRC:FSU:9682]
MSPKVHASLASSSTLLASCFAAGTKSVYWELANHYSDLDFRDKQNKGGYFAVLPSSSSLALHTQTHTYTAMAYRSRSRYSRSPSPPRRRRRSPSYSRSRSPSYSSRSRSRSPRRSMSPALTPKNTVLVTNLTRNVTADHVKEIFAQFGSVVKVDFPVNHRLNTNTGRAYVEYESKEDMDKAISYMNGGQLDGKHLDVDVAPAHRSPSPPSHRRGYSPPPPSRYRRGGGGGRPLPSGRRGRDRYLPSRDRYSLSRSRSPIRRGRRYSSYSRSRSRSYSPRGRSYSRSRSYSRRRSYSRSLSSGRSYSPRRRYSRSRSYDSRDYSSRSKSRSISPPPRGRSRRSISPRR